VQVDKSMISFYHEHDPYLLVDQRSGGTMVLAEVNVNEVAIGCLVIVVGLLAMLPVLLLWLVTAFCQAESTSKWALLPRTLSDEQELAIVTVPDPV
jgi:hypothetical protein